MEKGDAMIAEILSSPIMQRALLAVLLASIACGIVGSFVVVRKMTSISGGLSHAAFGGVGLGYLLGVGPLSGALVFTLCCAACLAFVYRRQRTHLETIVSMLWSLGMAVGMIALAFVPGGAPDLTHYLFGSILFVPKDYLFGLVGLDLLLLLVFVLGRREFLAVSFDEEFAEVRGLPVGWFFLFLLFLVALTVVLLMKVAGVILTIALLTTPAVIARQWVTRLSGMMFVASALAAVLSVMGLFLTYGISDRYAIDIPTGPVIILFSGAAFLVSSMLLRLRKAEGLR